MIKRILRYPYNLAIAAIVRHKIQKRIRSCTSLESTAWQQVENATDRALRFLDARRHSRESLFEYHYSAQSSEPTLYASAYSCMALSLLGKLDQISDSERLAWSTYFDSFQNESDGLFYDQVIENEIYADSDWWGARHLALHMISAYTALGQTPRYPFRFLHQYYDTDQLGAWLDQSDWNTSIGLVDDVDNKIMNIGCLLQYQRDTWKDAKAATAVSYLQGYLKDRINPETGMWGTWNIDNIDHCSRMVQFAYHLFPLFLYDRQPLDYPKKIVDLVLNTQNSFGGFGVSANSSACEDIDSIDILCRLAASVPERKAEIDEALRKGLHWVLCNQVDDGGFVFRLYEPLIYGHQEMSSGRGQGAMFPTWFRLLSLAYMARYFDVKSFSIKPAPGLQF